MQIALEKIVQFWKKINDGYYPVIKSPIIARILITIALGMNENEFKKNL